MFKTVLLWVMYNWLLCSCLALSRFKEQCTVSEIKEIYVHTCAYYGFRSACIWYTVPTGAFDPPTQSAISSYIEHVTSCKRINRFRSRCKGWCWCSWWRESWLLMHQSFIPGVSPPCHWRIDWMSNTSSTLCSMLSYVCPLIHILGCNYIEWILYFGE